MGLARWLGSLVAFRQKHTRDQKRELVLRAFEQRPELTFTKLKHWLGCRLARSAEPLNGWSEDGPPRRPDCVLGDRGYDAEAIRRGLRACPQNQEKLTKGPTVT